MAHPDRDPELAVHKEWLGFLQPVGLVVSPPALCAAQAVVSRNVIAQQQALRDLARPPAGDPDGPAALHPDDFPAFAQEVLGWEPSDLCGAPGGPPLPDHLPVPLPDYGDVLAPDYAVPDPEQPGRFLLLICKVAPGTALDQPVPDAPGWHASPQARLERLLRERDVPAGLLLSGDVIRLVYAPRGETSGHLSFPVQAMTEVPGRLLLGALVMLLSAESVFAGNPARRLLSILKESRKYQSEVSTQLSEQVLGALRTRPLRQWKGLDRGKYIDEDRKRRPVVPVRFVQACVNGHISDIDWVAFAHGEFSPPCRGPLWLDEGGSGGDLADIFVRCASCKARRPLSHAKLPESRVLGPCWGHRPWLGAGDREECQAQGREGPEYNRLLTRSASNAYFGQVLSVISIPDKDAEVRRRVDSIWDDELQYVEEAAELRRLRRKPKVSGALEGLSDEVVWVEIARRRLPGPAPERSIRQVEIEMLLSSRVEEAEDMPDDDFYATALPESAVMGMRGPLAGLVARVVLVHRLREVQAQVGFTRFEPIMADIEGELKLDVKLAALSREKKWVPAIENRGEGIFVAFSPEAVGAWLERPAVRARGEQLAAGFDALCVARGLDKEKVKFAGLPYVMLHSLSHLLITAVSLECGYAASSIRERIYAGKSGYGILLYTGTPGAEGTLGGLVEVGRRIERHLLAALELGRLCSNDPVCAQHAPDSALEERFLHGAACHGCLLIAEPSCERRNELLDRSLVVDTVAGLEAAFFGGRGA